VFGFFFLKYFFNYLNKSFSIYVQDKYMSFYELEFPVLNLEQLVINEYIFIYVSKI